MIMMVLSRFQELNNVSEIFVFKPQGTYGTLHISYVRTFLHDTLYSMSVANP